VGVADVVVNNIVVVGLIALVRVDALLVVVVFVDVLEEIDDLLVVVVVVDGLEEVDEIEQTLYMPSLAPYLFASR